MNAERAASRDGLQPCENDSFMHEDGILKAEIDVTIQDEKP